MNRLLTTLLLLFSITAYSQEYIHITYDDNGNRALRYLTHVGDNRVPNYSKARGANNDNTDNATSINNVFSETNVQISSDEEVGRVQVSLQEIGGDISLSLFGSGGQLLQHQKITDGSYTLDLSDYAAGVYLLSLRKGDSLREYKIVKK